MKGFVAGILLSTLAMFLWGMVYWGFSPLPYTAWKSSPDDVEAGKALREHFPESGTYYVPAMHHEAATLDRLYEQGPVAFVHLTSRDGRPRNEPSVMIKGLLLILVGVTLLALLLRKAAPALPTYGSRVRLIALTGLAAAVLIDVGDSVWWYIPIAWKVHQALYDFSAWTVAGLVLARFVKPENAA